MKKAIAILMLIISAQNVMAQDGILDTSFGNNGIVITDLQNNNDRASDLAVQTDNKILIVGMTSNQSSDNICVLRFLPDGSFDDAFGINGKVFLNFRL